MYQAYMPTFAGSVDGERGALANLRAALDYLNDGTPRSLGVDAVYLSPFYPSSGFDGGYDVDDHTSVAPWAGTDDDFANLVADAHARGVKIILDLVANHTSSRHPWFEQSRHEPDGPYGDWYYWRPGRKDGPPNNWVSTFDRVGSAWSYCEIRKEYYLHSFLPQQPDLDWRNPRVREAILAIMRLWLTRGADGFRVDAAHRLGKDPDLEDNPPLAFDERGYSERRDEDWPTALQYIHEMRKLVDSYGALLIGETYVLNSRRVARYAMDEAYLHLAHDFLLMHQDWNARAIAGVVREVEAALGDRGLPAWLLGNHDHSRLVTRLGGDGVGHHRAKVGAMLLLTLRGTVFVYQGDEAGLRDRSISAADLQDVMGRERYRSPLPYSPAVGERTLPNPESGFPDRVTVTQFGDLYRSLLWLRKTRLSLRIGSWTEVASDNICVLAYERRFEDERLVVALNFASSYQAADLRLAEYVDVLLSTSGRGSGGMSVSDLVLGPDEGVIISVR